jgi:hypothetical protein
MINNRAPGRRIWLAGGLRIAAAGAACVLFARTTHAAEKLPKSAVQYDETTRTAGRDCDDCTQFVPGPNTKARGTCRIVDGDISPHGHCIAFTPRRKP